MLNRQAIIDEVEEGLRILSQKAAGIPTRGWSDSRDQLGQWALRNGEQKPLRALAKLVLLLEPGATITIRR